MDILLAVLLLAALVLPLESLVLGSDRADETLPAVTLHERVDTWAGPVETTIHSGLFSQEFVRRRLDALADELERLDTDPDIFARAFRTNVARSAYDALRAEAAALTERSPSGAVVDVEFELLQETGR